MGKQTRAAEAKPRRNQAAGFALLEQWRKSGLSVVEFCECQDLSIHILRYWISQERKRRPSSKDFFVVSTKPQSSAETTATKSGSAAAFELRVNGIVVVVPLQAGHAAFAETLRVVLEETNI